MHSLPEAQEESELSMADDHKYEYEGQKLKRCDCGAEIFFVRHHITGKWMPVNSETGQSHFIDCPNAGQHRRRRGPGQNREVKYKNQKPGGSNA